MLRKLLIGPVLTGAGWIAGSYYGAEAQQLVHKSPSDTYDGISRAIDNMHSSGTTHFEGGTPMPYEIRAERTADQQLVVHLVFDGHEGATTELHFVPQDDGKDTMVSGKVHTDRSVLRQALAGTSSARLAYAPDWMLNLLMVRPLLRKLGEQIEQGQEMQVPGMSEAEWESSLTPDQQQQVQEARQYDASRPMIDPDADAARFTNQN